MAEQLLTVQQACDRLAIGRTTLYRLVADDVIQSIKVRGGRRIGASSIDEYIERQGSADPVDRYLRRVIDEAPPLTDSQRARLAAILAEKGRDDAA